MPADWAPSASFDALRLRAALNARIRDFFAARGVVEVDTPVLSAAGNTEPNIAPFSLDFNGRTDGGPRTRWLRTSPEYPLKRLLAAGFGDCYELGRVFRDGEAGGRHNPEFTMLEWYRVGWDHRRLVIETAELVNAALALVDRRAVLVETTYRDLYRDRLGIDPMTAADDELRAALGEVQVDPTGLTRDDWLDLLMTHRLQPGFADDAMIAIHDWPASQCALARLRRGDDGIAVAERFERDAVVRTRRGDVVPPVDGRLLDALRSGLPDCAGVALGVDRLMMAMLGTGRIADVVAFDFFRA